MPSSLRDQRRGRAYHAGYLMGYWPWDQPRPPHVEATLDAFAAEYDAASEKIQEHADRTMQRAIARGKQQRADDEAEGKVPA